MEVELEGRKIRMINAVKSKIEPAELEKKKKKEPKAKQVVSGG
jgi:hypothetical protein